MWNCCLICMSCSLAFRPISRQVFATLLFAAVLTFSCAVLTLGGVSQIFTALLLAAVLALGGAFLALDGAGLNLQGCCHPIGTRGVPWGRQCAGRTRRGSRPAGPLVAKRDNCCLCFV